MASRLAVFQRRWLRVEPQPVFDAFATPSTLGRWFGPGGAAGTEILEYDFRVGGRYLFALRLSDGRVEPVSGEFREVDPPRRLVFTWTWKPQDRPAGVDTLVSINIEPRDAGAEVVVTHDRLPTHEARDRYDEGWIKRLDRLCEWLEGETSR
jgi:uncharacterized protein YndB with AHSA1/START domain